MAFASASTPSLKDWNRSRLSLCLSNLIWHPLALAGFSGTVLGENDVCQAHLRTDLVADQNIDCAIVIDMQYRGVEWLIVRHNRFIVIA
jgi:hypothetical protein